MANNSSRLRNLVLGCAGAAVLLLFVGALFLGGQAGSACRDCDEGQSYVLGTLGVGSLVLSGFAALGATVSIASYAHHLGKQRARGSES